MSDFDKIRTCARTTAGSWTTAPSRYCGYGRSSRSKLALIPLPPRVGRAIDLAAGERLAGPVLLSRSGKRLDRHGATRIVRRVARKAGITKHISPHSLRHSYITAALDAGVPLRDVQIAARHADPRTTTRYDRARNNLDRHASYVVTAFVAGAA